VEEGRIVDFQMTVKRQQSLVNDIYRGRVVNLEPAIGAAFVDFGQGRNGFLHTSDVLSAYGDPDWKLDKLLTHKIDPQEWDEASSQPHVGVEFGVAERDEQGGASESAGLQADGSTDNPEAMLDADVEMEEVEGERDAAPETTESVAAEGFEGVAEAELDADSAAGGATEARSEPPAHSIERAPQAPPARRARGRDERRGNGNGRPQRGRPRLPITDLLKKGDPVVVQVTKEAIGDKGPTLTTYISIPGRYLVLMPSMSRTGVSRKIEDEKERRRLKKVLESLNVPPGMGLIVRTAGVGCTREDLRRDLEYLMLLWESFSQRLTLGRGPAELYEESDVALRTIRDLVNPATQAVIVDDARVFKRVKEFADKLMPEESHKIHLHSGDRPLFHAHSIEQDFEKIFSRRIDLPSGGSIVIDQAEALVAIDVNSGRTRGEGGFDFEQIALRTNLDAVAEIVRQIRLRDLGGILVIDFIDMMKSSSRRQVERALKDALALDRARTKLGRISQFGLLELTRQRLGPGLSKMLFQNCSRCRGSGRIRTVESRSGAILRRLRSAMTLKGFASVEVRAHPDVVEYLQRHCFSELKDLELRFERRIHLASERDQVEDSVLRYLRADGKEVRPGGRRRR
jgi:ribonuclease E